MLQDTAQVVVETMGNGVGVQEAVMVLLGYILGEFRNWVSKRLGAHKAQGKKL